MYSLFNHYYIFNAMKKISWWTQKIKEKLPEKVTSSMFPAITTKKTYLIRVCFITFLSSLKHFSSKLRRNKKQTKYQESSNM